MSIMERISYAMTMVLSSTAWTLQCGGATRSAAEIGMNRLARGNTSDVVIE
jgi:hypothetical protein